MTSPFTDLYDEGVKLVLFGGKGGVGKTTAAAAFALHLSGRHPEKRFLLVSTDPAHSLSDSLRFALAGSPQAIYGLENLDGVELDAGSLFEDFRRGDGLVLKEILRHGTYLDDDDLSRFLQLSFPGLDEVMALLRVMDLVEGAAYDALILDTAPTGHTLRLLELPGLMGAWTAFLDILLAKHRYLSRLYTRRYRPDNTDRFVDRLAQRLEAFRRLLEDRRRCRFIPVAAGEPLVLAETADLLQALQKRAISTPVVLVNQTRPGGGSCARCYDALETQRIELAKFHERWPDVELRCLPALPEEVRGEETLRSLGAAPWTWHEAEPGPGAPEPEAEPLHFPAPGAELEFLLFCGKGGVGKTTLAAAYALELSRCFPDRGILLFSTDPAHSVADALGVPVGPEPARVAEAANFFAVEIEPHALFDDFKGAYAREIEERFQELARTEGVELRFDRDVLVGLLDLAPPGLDEVMALTELSRYLGEARYDFYVIDMAPSGHALRFLELPGLMRDWLQIFFEVLLKYGGTARLPLTTELLVDLSRRVRRIQELLADPVRCECILVSLPTVMALLETQRLASSLAQLGVPMHRLVLNRVVRPVRGCPFCGARARSEEAVVARYGEAFPDLEIVQVPEGRPGLAGTRRLAGLLRFNCPVGAGA